MLSDSISKGVNFQNFLGGMPPEPPSVSMLRMLSVLRTLCIMCALIKSLDCSSSTWPDHLKIHGSGPNILRMACSINDIHA